MTSIPHWTTLPFVRTHAGPTAKALNLAVRVLLEIAAIVVLGWWGFHAGEHRFMQIGLGVGAPLMAIVVWGTFGSPRAPRRLTLPARLALQSILFVLAALAWAQAVSSLLWPGSFLLAATINTVLLVVWGQHSEA